MSRYQILKSLINKHRSQLVLTYLLFSLEMLGGLLRPFLLGLAINDLLQKNYTGIIALASVHFITLCVGTVRHMYDTRTYSAIYVSLVTKFLSRKVYGTDVSKLSAHSTLAREFIDFLEFDLVYVIEAVYNVFGSLIFMFFYNTTVVGLCLAVLVPVILMSKRFGKKMINLNKQKNDELEQQVDIIASGDRKIVHNHYNNLRNWQVRISNQEAWNFGFMEIIVMLVLCISVLLTYKMAGAAISIGSDVGFFFYLTNFTKGLDTIPYTLQRLTSLNDITRRIELHADDLPEDANLKPVRKNKRVKIGDLAA